MLALPVGDWVIHNRFPRPRVDKCLGIVGHHQVFITDSIGTCNFNKVSVFLGTKWAQYYATTVIPALSSYRFLSHQSLFVNIVEYIEFHLSHDPKVMIILKTLLLGRTKLS